MGMYDDDDDVVVLNQSGHGRQSTGACHSQVKCDTKAQQYEDLYTEARRAATATGPLSEAETDGRESMAHMRYEPSEGDQADARTSVQTELTPPSGTEENNGVSRGKAAKTEALVQRKTQGDGTTTTTRRKRQRCHIMTLLPLTENVNNGTETIRIPIDFRVYNEASAWLAWHHLVNPEEFVVLPEVTDRLASCSVDFSMRMWDSRFSGLNAARQLLRAVNETDVTASDNDVDADNTRPTVVVGAARSAVTTALSFLTSVYGIPQISGSSTAANLDRKDTHALFGRTVPTNRGDAQAMTLYLSDLGVTHAGILYIADDFGTNFHADLVKELVSAGINVFSQGYDDDSIESAIEQLVSSGMRYFIGILNPNTWRPLVEFASKHEIMGHPDYFWMLSESSLEFVNPAFELDRTNDSRLAKALHGSGLLSLTVPAHDAFDSTLQLFSERKDQQELFVNQHGEPGIFDSFSFPSPGRSLYQYLTYDAVIALAIATCECPEISSDEEDDVIAMGKQLYDQFLKTEFEGVSGYVSFDPLTGTRRSADVMYQIQNIVLSDELSTDRKIRFTSNVSALVELDVNRSADQVEVLDSFTYWSNTTQAPLPLPQIDEDMNLLSRSVQGCGLALGACVMIISIGWMIWTFLHREKDVVKASQPIFLFQICIGTLIAASAVIPMSMQEPTSPRGLDIACMATPWLISVGFVTVFSALFSKTWRLNRLFKHGRGMRRVTVRPRDVALPFFVLLATNFSFLIAWTVTSPQVWERDEVENFDIFGRSVETIGSCQPTNGTTGAVYVTLIVAVNLLVLFFANYQAYHARNLPTDFSESSYIFVAMASLLEVFLLGIPLIFLAKQDTRSSFLIRSILLSLSCLCILLPVFIPKWIQRNTNKRYEAAKVRSEHEPLSANHGAPLGAPLGRRSSVHVSISGSDGNHMLSENGSMSFSNSASTAIREFCQVGEADGNSNSASSLRPAGPTGAIRVKRNSEYFKQQLIHQ